MNRLTHVRTPFGPLVAPRGFGATYRRAAMAQWALTSAGKPGEVIGPLRDLLLLVGYDASIGTVAEWTAQERIEAEVYAANVHLRASDNAVQRHPKPEWLPEPWGGPEVGDGIFSGPSPTTLEARP